MDTYYANRDAVRLHDSGQWVIGTVWETAGERRPGRRLFATRDEALAALPPAERLVPLAYLREGDVITLDGTGIQLGLNREPVSRVEVDERKGVRLTTPGAVMYGGGGILAVVHLAE